MQFKLSATSKSTQLIQCVKKRKEGRPLEIKEGGKVSISLRLFKNMFGSFYFVFMPSYHFFHIYLLHFNMKNLSFLIIFGGWLIKLERKNVILDIKAKPHWIEKNVAMRAKTVFQVKI
jgi:hypothetical protein